MAYRIKLRRDTIENYTTVNPVLADGEICLISTDASNPNTYDKQKVGDGIHKFSELPMINANYIQDNNEFIYVKIDKEGNIISCVDSKGTYIFRTDVRLDKKILAKAFEVGSTDKDEFIYVQLDKDGHVISSIGRDGVYNFNTNVRFKKEVVIPGVDAKFDTKVDKENGKGLIDDEIINSLLYEDNGEFMYVKLDKEGYVISSIDHEGIYNFNRKVKFSKGIISPELDSRFNTKVDKEEGMGLVSDEIKESIQYEDSNEFIYVKLDKDGHIIACIDNEGIYNFKTKVKFDKEIISAKLDERFDVKVDKEEGKSLIGNEIIDSVYYGNDEFMYVKLDKEGYILACIDSNGIYRINRKVKFTEGIEVTSGIDFKIGNGIKDEIIGSIRYIDDEFINMVFDKEGRVLSCIDAKGTHRFNTDAKFGKKVTYPAMDVDSTNSNEFIYVKLDKDGHIIACIDNEGIYNFKTKVKFDKGFVSPDIEALQKGLELKVDKEEGKGLIDSDVAESSHYIDNNEFLYVKLDKDGRVLEGVNVDGSKYVSKISLATMLKLIAKDEDSTGISGDDAIPSKAMFNCQGILNDSIGTLVHNKMGILNSDYYLYADSNNDLLAGEIKNCGFNLARLQASPNCILYKRKGVEILAIDVIGTSKTIEENDAIIETKLSRYDGNYHDDLVFEDKKVAINVKYWQFYNEPLNNYPDSKITPLEYFNRAKAAYIKAKSVRSDVVVVGAGLNNYNNDSFEVLCQIEDEDGKHYWDYVDAIALQHYCNSWEDDMSVYARKMKAVADSTYNPMLQKNLCDVPLWISEFNTYSYSVTEEQQAEMMPRAYILGLAYGFDKCVNYCFYCFDYFRISNLKEACFGLTKSGFSDDTSYISYIKNDGVYDKPISVGEQTLKIFLHSKKAYLNFYHSGDLIYKNIKESGLAISGQGFVIGSIIAKTGETSVTIWEGEFAINTPSDIFTLDQSYFSEVTYSTDITINLLSVTKPVSTDDAEFVQFSPRPVYYSLKTLFMRLQNGATRPTFEVRDNGMYIAVWKKSNGQKVLALWHPSKTVIIPLEVSGDFAVYDYMGNLIEKDSVNFGSLEISPKILYIDNYKQFKI